MAKQTKNADFNYYLTQDGRNVLEYIKKHCEAMGLWHEEYHLEASMLANVFVLYCEAAYSCNQPNGTFQKVGNGGYKQVSVELTIMDKMHDKILKHAPKFGLNPADLEKHFAGLKKAEKKPDFAE
ncbi:MAG TPA: hypothetical protein VK508_01825 [Cyclobacteriaceae bacterium]|nr:hypothetical protein [Cyclobacteriaceae bacterium]